MIETIKIETDDSSDGEHGQNRKGCVGTLSLSFLLSCKPEPDACIPVSTLRHEGLQTTKQTRMRKVSVVLVDCHDFIAGKPKVQSAIKSEPTFLPQANAPTPLSYQTQQAFKECGTGSSIGRRAAVHIPMRGLSVVLVDCCKSGRPNGSPEQQGCNRKGLSRGSLKSPKVTSKMNTTLRRKTILDCSECGKSFKTLKQLKEHQCGDTGQSTLSCPKCDKRFTSPGNLVRHQQQNHTKRKPYRCSLCNCRFRRREHLVLHQRTHTGERPHFCPRCQKAFSDPTHLRNHQRQHDTKGGKPYQCSECDRSFRDPSNLSKHKRIHSGVRPYQCNECGQRFNRTEHLKEHKRTHTGERPYACQLCGRGFGRKAHLRLHLRTHRGSNKKPKVVK
ncbi:zinc finger protein 691-like isoform X2 [Engraulis encrasicolus]|uniref:zinc finger protein 691-like isoform X2 n=1 Tax=Engraulis encrasicolus TaxID=184585 RepID=UPI002FD01117